jgi:hypothetical protein
MEYAIEAMRCDLIKSVSQIDQNARLYETQQLLLSVLRLIVRNEILKSRINKMCRSLFTQQGMSGVVQDWMSHLSW